MNVRGLNDPVKRDALREFVNLMKVNLVCLQETRLAAVDAFIVMQCLGPAFDSFTYLSAQETRGGVIVAWDSSVLKLTRVSFDSFWVNALVTGVDNVSWWITVVYGPQSREDKIQFLRELTERRALCPGPWLLIGDFNMILRASEKNNDNLDRFMMARFRDFVGQLELRDLYMHGRLFTWSNEREVPTMTRIDRALVSVDWDLTFPDAMLQALSTSFSDHALLHLALCNGARPKQRFKFEVFWASLPGFQEAVREAWVCDDSIVDPFKRLDALFRNAAVSLQAWGQKSVGNVKLQIAMANIIILRFDAAQERRHLNQGERWLRNTLKLTVLGLSSLERTIARQRSRLRWLKEGDANSKLFHAVANGRRAKKIIPAIRVGDRIFTDQSEKEESFFQSYSALLGEVRNRVSTVDLDNLGFQRFELDDLEAMFTTEEVWKVIRDMPSERAPGPDGFIGLFYQKAWGVIRNDIMATILKLGVGDG
jgi:mannosylglycoprotein endo-beta-mannosidase